MRAIVGAAGGPRTKQSAQLAFWRVALAVQNARSVADLLLHGPCHKNISSAVTTRPSYINSTRHRYPPQPHANPPPLGNRATTILPPHIPPPRAIANTSQRSNVPGSATLQEPTVELAQVGNASLTNQGPSQALSRSLTLTSPTQLPPQPRSPAHPQSPTITSTTTATGTLHDRWMEDTSAMNNSLQL